MVSVKGPFINDIRQVRAEGLYFCDTLHKGVGKTPIFTGQIQVDSLRLRPQHESYSYLRLVVALALAFKSLQKLKIKLF